MPSTMQALEIPRGEDIESFRDLRNHQTVRSLLAIRSSVPHCLGKDSSTCRLEEGFEKTLAFLACMLGLTSGKIQNEAKIKLLKRRCIS